MFWSISVTLAGGTYKGFLCQARTTVDDDTTKVGTLAASGSVTMTNNCDSVCNQFYVSYPAFMQECSGQYNVLPPDSCHCEGPQVCRRLTQFRALFGRYLDIAMPLFD